MNPSLLRGLAFDYATAFRPVSLVATFPQVLAVKNDLPVRDVAGLVAAAKARPGALTVGTQGNATAGHLGLAQFSRLDQIVAVPVGSSPAEFSAFVREAGIRAE